LLPFFFLVANLIQNRHTFKGTQNFELVLKLGISR
jgi:hypothetical protein